MDSLIPVVIASVCRYWRSTILSLPSAWSIINSESVWTYDTAFVYVKTFLERSGPTSVHLHLPYIIDGKLSKEYKSKFFIPIISAASRITCLWISRRYFHGLLQNCFPNITTLSLESTDRDITTSLFKRSNFPALRSLNSGGCTWVSDSSADSPSLPPLKYLSIGKTCGTIWIRVVQEFSTTLKGLAISLSYRRLPQETVHFPLLEYLYIHEFNHPDTCPIQAITPVLNTYEEYLRPRSQGLNYAIVKNVRYLRSFDAHRLASYPSLEIFQLSADDTVLVALAKQLKQREELCPNLRRIEFARALRANPNLIDAAKRMIKFARPHIELVQLIFPPRWSHLPGSGNDLTCRRDP